MCHLDRAYSLAAPCLDQRPAQPFGQARRASGRPCVRTIRSDLAQHRIGQTLEMAKMLVARDNRDHRIDHTMRRAAGAQFHGAHTQRVLHGHWRVLIKMFLQDAVGALQSAQRILCQTLRARAIVRRQLVESPGSQQFGHQLAFAQHLIQQVNGGFAGLNAGI